MKRILSLILCLAMVLSMLPAQVFATETETVYTVTFEANGGEGTMEVQTVTAENTPLTANAFSRTCHRFTGWNTEADGSGTGYAEGAEVTLTENLTLYAQWKLEHTGGTTVKYAQAPGCETEGYTGNTFCNGCGAQLSVGEGIAPKGHDWQEATCKAPKTCSVCKATEGEALPHTEGDPATCTAAQTCQVCGAELAAALGHVDANKDHKCDRGCGKTDMGTHGDSPADKDHVCDYGCGAVLEACSDKTGDKNHACDICGKADITAHTYADATCTAAQTCTECGATTGEALGHVDANKDHKCDRGCGKTDMGTHEDANKDHKCDYGCAEEIGAHADANKDHKCDYGCAEEIGAHEDANKDHKCDYGCAGEIGAHEDANKDHKCDYGCAGEIGTHSDANKDHACDYGCAVYMGTHEDANKDHKCDYGCAEGIGNHGDSATDKDHVCDYGCGAVLEDCADAAKDGNHACDVCGKTVTACAASLVKTAAVAETCTEAGNKEYYTCSDCGKYYSDSKAKTEIAKDSWIIAPKGHDWGSPSSYDIHDNGTHTAKYTCRHDATHTRQDDPVAHTYDAATHACVCGHVDSFTITFDTAGGSEIPAITQPYNSKVAKPADPVKEGHTFAGWDREIPDTMPGEDITITAKWTVNSYNAVFNAGDGAWEDGKKEITVETLYGQVPVKPADPQKLGYIFVGWTPELVPMGIDGAVYTAVYEAGTVNYTVETYIMDLSGSYGEAAKETRKGTTDTVVKEEPAEKTGFTLDTENSVLEGAVAADGSLVLKVYYSRNKYTLTTVVEGVTTETQYYFAQNIVLDDPTKYNAGGCPFPFTGWDSEVPAAMPAQDLLFTAVFAETVIHKSEDFTYTDNGWGWHDLAHACCADPAGKAQHAYDNAGFCICDKVQPEAWGYLEEPVYWEFDANVLTVTADGAVAMADFASSGDTPWQAVRSNIKAVNVADGVTAIGAYAFADCDKLCTVNLPESVTAIGAAAFQNCKSLFGINLPGELKEIADYTFQGCALNNINLPGKVTTIGAYAFAGNKVNDKNLTKLTIPAGVTEIKEGAFSNCIYMDTLTVYTTNLTVKQNAFSGCDRLKKIYFSGSDAQWNALNIDKTGNNKLLTATKVYENTDHVPVQSIHILDVSGVSGTEGAILDGKVVVVDLNKVTQITLGYQVLPKEATNPEISWTSYDLAMASSKLGENKELILTNMKNGDMTIYAQNYIQGSMNHSYATATVRLQFRRMEISGGFDGRLPLDNPVQLSANILGDGNTRRTITWSVENQNCEAEITSRGKIKVTKAGEDGEAGKVIVRATTAGGRLAAEKTFVVTDSEYHVEFDQPEGGATVAAGKSITLKARLLPSNMSGTSIRWKLANPEDAQYITPASGKANARGEIKLTAKKTIQQTREVVVQAYSADGQAQSAEITVTVVPVAGAVVISRNQEDVTGQTVLFDLNQKDAALSFSALTTPADADKRVTWKVSDTKGTYVTYTTDDSGTITLTPQDKTGTVTLTATAADGSGKKATVKVQFVRAADHIEILNNPGVLRAGSKLTLTTNLATDKDLTDRNVIWKLAEEDLPFASINEKGVLTTYAFPNPVTITVSAAVKARPEFSTEIKIDLLPGAQEARISRDGKALGKNELVYAAVGETVTLAGSTLPAVADQAGTWKVTGKNVKWTPSEDGKTLELVVSQPGTVTVTFTAADGSRKAASVKVQAVQRGQDMTITARKGETELRSGRSLQLTAAVNGATIKKFSWTVSDPSAATVSATGTVKALTVYENTDITVTAAAIDGSALTAEYKLTIKPAKDETLHVVLGGETVTGTTQFASRGAEAKSLEVKLYNAVDNTWTDVTAAAAITVGGKAVTRTENGIAPAAVGNSNITAKYDDLSAKVTVKVVNPVERIEISAKDGANFLLAGKTLNLKAAVTGANGAKPTVAKLRWSVDNTAAATVSASGALKAVKNLTEQTKVSVTAEATDGSGVKATYDVTIYPQLTAILVKADGIILNQCVRQFRVESTLTLTSEILPKGAMQGVTWSINKPKLAKLTVAEDGTASLTLLAKGEVTIKAVVNDGSKKTVSVKIKIV